MSHAKCERDALSLVSSFLHSRRDIEVSRILKRKHNFIQLRHVKTGVTRKVVFSSTPSCHRWLFHLKKDLRRVVRDIEESSSESGVST